MAIASVKKLIWCVNCHQRKKMFCHNGQDGNNCKWKAYSVFSYLYSVNSSPQKKKKKNCHLPAFSLPLHTYLANWDILTYLLHVHAESFWWKTFLFCEKLTRTYHFGNHTFAPEKFESTILQIFSRVFS